MEPNHCIAYGEDLPFTISCVSFRQILVKLGLICFYWWTVTDNQIGHWIGIYTYLTHHWWFFCCEVLFIRVALSSSTFIFLIHVKNQGEWMISVYQGLCRHWYWNFCRSNIMFIIPFHQPATTSMLPNHCKAYGEDFPCTLSCVSFGQL